MLEPTTEGLATAAGDPQLVVPEPMLVDADLDDRITRLEQLVAALGLLLDRFQGGGPALSETAFDNLEDPAASRAVLSILVASTADARWDVLALRRAIRDLGEDPDAALGDPSLPRLDRLANSARELKNRFEAFRASIGKGAPARSANATAQLQQVVALSIRALLDVSESMDGLRPGASSLEPAPEAAPEALGPVSSSPEPRRRALAAPAALMQLVGRRRNRLVAEGAALAVVVVVVLGSLQGREGAPGSLAGAGSSSVAPSATNLEVAVGSFVPSESVLVPPSSSPAPTDPGSAPTPRPTSAPPPPPRPTPRPTPAPAPTSSTAAAAARFDGRMSSAADSIDGLLAAVTDAVQASDFAGAKAAAVDIVATAQTARSWLQSHPPKACYGAVQDSAMATLGDLIATAGDIAEDADAADGNAIHKDVANSHGDVSALRRDGNKAVSFCA